MPCRVKMILHLSEIEFRDLLTASHLCETLQYNKYLRYNNLKIQNL